MKKFGIISLILFLCSFFGLFFYVGSHAGQMPQFADQKRKINILLNGSSISSDTTSKLKIDGSTLTIYEPGVYSIRGELNDGQIIIDTRRDADVVLHFCGVNINCSSSSPVLVKEAKSVTIKVKNNSQNSLTDGSEYKAAFPYEEVPTGCIYSKCDLKIKMEAGFLAVNGNFKDGIVCKDDLKITGGDIAVNANRNGIYGKDSLTLKNCSVSVDVPQDGLKSKGTVTVIDGNLNIHSSRYGIYAFDAVNITENNITKIEGAHSNIGCIGTIDLSYVPETNTEKEETK